MPVAGSPAIQRSTPGPVNAPSAVFPVQPQTVPQVPPPTHIPDDGGVFISPAPKCPQEVSGPIETTHASQSVKRSSAIVGVPPPKAAKVSNSEGEQDRCLADGAATRVDAEVRAKAKAAIS